MLIRVKFFGPFKELVGKGWTAAEVHQGISLSEFIHRLAERCDPRLVERVFGQDGDLRPHVTILVNGRNIAHLDHLDTKLKDKDTVALFPVAGGG